MARQTPPFVLLSVFIGIPLVIVAIFAFTPAWQHLKETVGEDYVVERSVDLLVSTDGLEETLKVTYSEFTEPEHFYDALWLNEITTIGTTVTHIYQFRAPFDDVSDVYTEEWETDEICSEVLSKRFLAYGATYVNRYLDEDSYEIGTVTVTAETCGIDLF